MADRSSLDSGSQMHCSTKTSLIQSDTPADLYLEAWLTQSRTPLILVLPDLSLVWANEVARAMEAQGHFSLANSWLSIGNVQRNAKFLEFVGKLNAVPSAWSGCSAKGEHILVCGETFQLSNLSTGIALRFRVTADPHYPLIWADLNDALGLTKREVFVVKQLFAGESAEDISLNNNLSIETVRTHIRSIYLKMRINSREQLFNRLSKFCAG